MSTADAITTAVEATRLAGIESELTTLKRRLKREASISTAITVVVLLLLSFYFYYGYSEFSKLLKPDEIVNLGASLVDSNIPIARRAVEDEVKRSAPVWAEQLSNQAVESIPELRSQLEKYALEQSEQTIQQFVNISRDQFRNALREHHDEFQDLVTELSTRREATDELVLALEDALNQELGQNMQTNAEEVLETVRLANDKLLHLSIGKNLTDDERQERYVLTIFRRLQMEEGNKLTLTGNSAPFSFLNPAPPSDEMTSVSVPAIEPVGLEQEATETSKDAAAGPAKSAESDDSDVDSTDDARIKLAEAVEKRARAAEEAAAKAAAEQQQAARAAQAATDLARLAAKDAREATVEARKAHDELRKAEKDARAAIQELIRLQKQSAKPTEPTEVPKSDDGESEPDAN